MYHDFVLYLYMAANYYQRSLFFNILDFVEAERPPIPEEIMNIIGKRNLYQILSDQFSKDRNILNHVCFRLCVELKANSLAEHILTNSVIILNQDIMN
jgi:hypothetical protein